MKSFAIASLTLLGGLGAFWYVADAIRSRYLEMGRFFGKRISFHWSSEPIRFLFGILGWLAFGLFMLLAGVAFGLDVDPSFWALWLGVLGPVAAILLARRHYGPAADRQTLAAAAAHVLRGERQEAQKLVESQAVQGSTRRLMEVALGTGPTDDVAPDYRTGPARHRSAVVVALERALESERRRGRLRTIPAAATLVTCAVLLVRPPGSDRIEAWTVAGVELAFTALALWLERRMSRRPAEVLAVFGSS